MGVTPYLCEQIKIKRDYYPGLQNQSVMYVMDTLGLNGTVFLDANSLSSDGTISLADYAFSEDGETLAYALSTNGADWREIRFKSTKTGM